MRTRAKVAATVGALAGGNLALGAIEKLPLIARSTSPPILMIPVALGIALATGASLRHLFNSKRS